MRPLPLAFVPRAPDYLMGASVVRGAALPVVNLAALMGPSANSIIRRFVTLRTGERQACVAVEEVLGVREISHADLTRIDPLLNQCNRDYISAIGVVNKELLTVLQCSALIEEEVWNALDSTLLTH